MENFCKHFDFQEILDLDDPFVLSDTNILKFIKSYGMVVREGVCHLNGNPCTYIKNTGKVSFVFPFTMVMCKKYPLKG